MLTTSQTKEAAWGTLIALALNLSGLLTALILTASGRNFGGGYFGWQAGLFVMVGMTIPAVVFLAVVWVRLVKAVQRARSNPE